MSKTGITFILTVTALIGSAALNITQARKAEALRAEYTAFIHSVELEDELTRQGVTTAQRLAIVNLAAAQREQREAR